MNIEKITSEGIHYINDYGQSIFLSFNECNENWLAYMKRTEHLSDEKVADLIGKTDGRLLIGVN